MSISWEPPAAADEGNRAAAVVGDDTREVVVLVDAIDEFARGQVLQFGLVVAQRDGRWEVVELRTTPSLTQGKQ